MWKGKKVSIVMPAYNEEKGIVDTIQGFKNIKEVDEIIVVDNNSKDRTVELAMAAGAKIVQEKKQGYSYACRTALASASGDYVVLTESDNSFLPNDIYKFFAFIEEFDMVKGGRSNKHMIEKGADWGIFLKYGNWFIAKMTQVLYNGPSMREAGGTYRMMKRSCIQEILPYLTCTGAALLPDMVTITLRRKMKILEIPVYYRQREGKSKITGNKIRAFFLGLSMIRIILWNRVKPMRR